MDKESGCLEILASSFMWILTTVINFIFKAVLWCVSMGIFLYLFKAFGFPKILGEIIREVIKVVNSNVSDSIIPDQRIVTVFGISGLKFFILI